MFDRHLDRSEGEGLRWTEGFPELRPTADPGAGWSVPWSDLMMVMFILFVVLFVTEAAERDVGEILRPEENVVESSVGAPWLPWRSLGQVSAGAPSAFDGVDVAIEADDSVRLSLPSALLFALGSAEIGPDAGEVLGEVAAVIARFGGAVQVIGHTDDFPVHSPTYPTNWELSAARASAVTRALIWRGRLDPRRFTVQGRGMYSPAVPNISAENKARNRRVEILIAPQDFLRVEP